MLGILLIVIVGLALTPNKPTGSWVVSTFFWDTWGIRNLALTLLFMYVVHKRVIRQQFRLCIRRLCFPPCHSSESIYPLWL
jgi:hypothetical protein